MSRSKNRSGGSCREDGDSLSSYNKGPTEFLTGYGRFRVIMEARSPTGGGFWSDVLWDDPV